MATVSFANKIAQKQQVSLDSQAETVQDPKAEPLIAEEPSSPTVPVRFRSKGLHQFYKADGSRVAPVDGYYVPRDAEEWDLLAHYAEVHDLVVPE